MVHLGLFLPFYYRFFNFTYLFSFILIAFFWIILLFHFYSINLPILLIFSSFKENVPCKPNKSIYFKLYFHHFLDHISITPTFTNPYFFMVVIILFYIYFKLHYYCFKQFSYTYSNSCPPSVTVFPYFYWRLPTFCLKNPPFSISFNADLLVLNSPRFDWLILFWLFFFVGYFH